MPEQATIASAALMEQAIGREPDEAVQVALELAWITAARGGDVLRLRAGDVASLDSNGVGITKVRFVVGKTASQNPYTVTSCPLSPGAQRYIQMRVKETEPTGWLFPKVTGTMLCTALRRADPRLEQRSMRRGAIQFLASTGITDEDLMVYSRHRCIETLRRYLNFGWVSGEVTEHGRRAQGLALSLEED